MATLQADLDHRPVAQIGADACQGTFRRGAIAFRAACEQAQLLLWRRLAGCLQQHLHHAVREPYGFQAQAEELQQLGGVQGGLGGLQRLVSGLSLLEVQLQVEAGEGMRALRQHLQKRGEELLDSHQETFPVGLGMIQDQALPGEGGGAVRLQGKRELSRGELMQPVGLLTKAPGDPLGG